MQNIIRNIFNDFARNVYWIWHIYVYTNCENTHCVGLLFVVPPQGCEAILIKILQLKRSAAGLHFPRYFHMSKLAYNKSKYTIRIY